MWLIALLFSLFAMSCANLPPPPADKHASTALALGDGTALGRIAAASSPLPGASGFLLEISGNQAFDDRLVLIDKAERTLDLQYYIVERDESVRTLMTHLRRAAERGVRVRLLIDDMNTVGLDLAYLRIDAHPNIEVRIFNPFPAGRFSVVSRFIASMTDFRRVSRRMHNKVFIADNAIAISGGRNLGDQYFVRSAESNFVDMDVVSAGPIVRQLSGSFDRYWNHELAYPIRTIAAKGGQVPAAQAPPAPPTALPEPESLRAQLERGRLRFEWVPVKMLVDKPGKLLNDTRPDDSVPVAIKPDAVSGPAGKEPLVPASDEIIYDDVAALMRSAQKEVVIISPYLVPGERGITLWRQLAARGVRLRILTNSLAATDAAAVHIGYAKYRPQLLDLGAELYEQRPRIGEAPRLGAFGSSRASLHTKALVIDGKTLFIGSMNMDPRSAYENTELGLVIRSPVLAGQVLRLFEEQAAKYSYRVGRTADGALRWSATVDGRPRTWDAEPEAGAKLKAQLFLLRPFAPEEML